MMKKILVISNTAFSVEKFREHYLSKINDYKFIIYTPNKLANLKKKYKNITLKKFTSQNIFDDLRILYKLFKNSDIKDVIVYSNKYQFITCYLNKIFNLNLKITSIIAGRGSLPLGNLFERNFYKVIIKTIIAESKVVTCINPYDLNYFRKFSINEKKKFFLIPTEGVEKINLNKKISQKKNFIFLED